MYHEYIRFGTCVSMTALITYLVAFVHSLHTMTDAARILGIFPVGAKSHFYCNHAILESLHDAGHQVTMISPFPPTGKSSTKNFTYVDSRLGSSTSIGVSNIDDFTDMSVGSKIHSTSVLDIKYCYNIMKLPQIQEALNSSVKLYDILLTELMVDFECYLPIAQKLGIPVIGTVTLRSWQPAEQFIGLVRNPAVMPAELAGPTIDMNFIERMQNLWNTLVMDYYYYVEMRGLVREFYREHFAEDLLYKKQISLVFINNHASLLSRSGVANAIEIGGIHVMKPAKPLPADVQKFIDDAPQGVILFTLGSVVKASSMSMEQKQAFLTAFESIPQRVIWKFEEPIENLPKNIIISDWLPQRDILEHKNVIVFMSHCGLGGVYEAIITGTPVITMPLFADQQANAAVLHYRGVGVDLNMKTVTKELVLAALNTIINDTSYYENMQELSRVFRDRPMTPQESIVYWTEYVLRHNGAPHLKAIGTDMPFYKYCMLDIILFLLAVVSVIVLTLYLVFRKLLVAVKQKSSCPRSRRGNRDS